MNLKRFHIGDRVQILRLEAGDTPTGQRLAPDGMCTVVNIADSPHPLYGVQRDDGQQGHPMYTTPDILRLHPEPYI